jgi:hypothetical protein
MLLKVRILCSREKVDNGENFNGSVLVPSIIDFENTKFIESTAHDEASEISVNPASGGFDVFPSRILQTLATITAAC